MGHTFLLVIDAHSKWPEISVVNSMTSTATIKRLSQLFSSYGLPKVIVTDNAATFLSQEFQQFVRSNGIKHITGAPFHPASNGQAERYVHTMKQALRSMEHKYSSIQESLNEFLLAYRRTPNITTGESPARLFLKRDLRTRLDILRSSIQEVVSRHTIGDKLLVENRTFSIGQRVAVRNYNSPNKKWMVGTVVNKDGDLNYTVLVNGQMWRRHVDQVRPVGTEVQEPPQPFVFPGLVRNVSTTPEERRSIQPSTCPAQLQGTQRTDTTPRKSSHFHSSDLVSSTPKLDNQSVCTSQKATLERSNLTQERVEDIVRKSSRTRKAPQRMNL